MIVHESMLDVNQVRFICRKSEKYVLLAGCVKSGKTICMLHKCKQLLANNTQAEILWLTQNSLYKSFLCSAFNELGIKCILQTINEFFKANTRSYDYVFVDEASFLTDEQLKQIANISCQSLFLSITEGDIRPPFFFQENAKGVDSNVICRLLKIKKQSLLFSFLNNGTKKLLSELCDNESEILESIVNHSPSLCQYKELLKLESIVEFIKNRIINREERNVAILCYSNDDVANICHEFSQSTFKVESKYSKSVAWKNDIDFTSCCPKVMTIHSCVGISFDNVYVILNKRLLDNFEEHRDLIAYAVTRGLHDVVIISDLPLPNVITDNATQISDEAEINI
ncbi:MAG: hypothetical protein MJZ29_07610 [Bacteroidaceae bacterium]|nr:hypothetical protein [Bacteroidaceae bacterium]